MGGGSLSLSFSECCGCSFGFQLTLLGLRPISLKHHGSSGKTAVVTHHDSRGVRGVAMDFSHLVGDHYAGLSCRSVLWAMASAALPKSENGRQPEDATSMEFFGHRSQGFGRSSGDTVADGLFGMGSNPTTTCMVRQAQQPNIGVQLNFEGGGGWQPWTSRHGSVLRPPKEEVSKPIGVSNLEKPHKRRLVDYGKPWWEKGEGDLPQEYPRGVKDAGGSQSKVPGRRKVTLKEVSNQFSSAEGRRNAVTKLRNKMFAKSTLASKASKRRKLCEVLEKVKGEADEFFPVTAQELELAGALLSELQLKAGEQYINEIKLMQLEAGFKWDEVLERQLAMIKRALRRDSGPDKRALEVKPDLVEVEDPDSATKANEGKPVFPKMSYVFTAVWMLRSGEASTLKVKHLSLDVEKKTASLTIPKAKMDQAAKGTRRTLACCGAKPCKSTCPWRISVRVKTWMAGSTEDDGLIADIQGKPVSRFLLVKSWAESINPKMSGHSARRSGAMFYTRQGLSLSDIMFLGRWKSAAVFRYMEEAMAELPVNQRSQHFSEAKFSDTQGATSEEQQDPPNKAEDKPVIQGPKIAASSRSNKPLWAISSSRGGKVAHRVGRASWGMPVSEWTTICGWHFAGANSRVELTRFKEFSIRSCQKCKGLFSLRDNVKGGVELAQLVEI